MFRKIMFRKGGILCLLLVACDIPGSSVPTTSYGGETGDYYTIEEVYLYEQPTLNCPSVSELNVVTSTLNGKFASEWGWNGFSLLDSPATCSPGTAGADHCPIATDYVEASPFPAGDPIYPGLAGEDSVYADARRFSLFAGHGNQGVLGFRRGFNFDNGQLTLCQAFFPDLIQLGVGMGGRNRVAAYAASCVGHFPDSLETLPGVSAELTTTFGSSSTWQHMMFFDSPSISPFALTHLVDCIDQPAATNHGCWEDSNLYTSLGATAYNMPFLYTVASSGETPEQRQVRHENANIKTWAHLPPTSLSAFGQTYAYSGPHNVGNPSAPDLEFDPLCSDEY